MKQKEKIRLLLIAALVAVSIGGFLLHLRIHSPMAAPPNLIPFIAGIASVLLIPALFLITHTRAYAYVINGMLAIIGIITMANVSILNPPKTMTIASLFLGTLLGSGITLLTNFMIGKALFELEMFKAIDAASRHGHAWRYPNTGWWCVHLFALSTVYILGYALWE